MRAKNALQNVTARANVLDWSSCMDFVDTNIFLRYLTQDQPVAAQKCFELFQRVKQKEIQLATSESVLAEVVYGTTQTLYNLELRSTL